MKRILFLLVALAVMGWCAPAHADEVDDILAMKAKSRERIKSYSAEYVVETRLPKVKSGTARVSRMRYRMRIEHLPKDKVGGMPIPWKTELEMLEPYAMSMRVEGERVWLKKGNGWAEQEITPHMHEQFTGMSERFLGADPAVQRKQFSIRILRHNKSIFGPRTRTVEFVPRGKARLFARMEEDINDDGLPLETRIYDDSGKQAVCASVKKHHRINGVPVVDAMESVAETPGGRTTNTTVITEIVIDTNDIEATGH